MCLLKGRDSLIGIRANDPSTTQDRHGGGASLLRVKELIWTQQETSFRSRIMKKIGLTGIFEPYEYENSQGKWKD